MDEVELAPFQGAAGRAVRRVVGIGLHALHVADMFDAVDGAEAAVTGPSAASEERGEGGCRVRSHLGCAVVQSCLAKNGRPSRQNERIGA